VPRDRVDRTERLVHEHDIGIRAHRPGDTDALSLSAGELLRVAVAVVARDADRLEQLVDPAGDPRAIPPEHLGYGGDVLRDGHVREQPDLLDDVADPAPQMIRVDVGDVLVLEEDAPGAGLDQPVDHLHGRRLAAARRTRHHDDLPFGDLHVERVHGGLGLAGEPLLEVLQPDLGPAVTGGVAVLGHLSPRDVVSRLMSTNSRSNRMASTMMPSMPPSTRLTAIGVPTRAMPLKISSPRPGPLM